MNPDRNNSPLERRDVRDPEAVCMILIGELDEAGRKFRQDSTNRTSRKNLEAVLDRCRIFLGGKLGQEAKYGDHLRRKVAQAENDLGLEKK